MRSNVLANCSGVISRLWPTGALSNSSTLQLSTSSFELRQPLKVSPHKRPVLRRNVRALEGAVHAGHQRGGHCLRERPRGSGPAGADHLRGAHLTLTLDAADPLGRPLSLEARSGRAEPVVDAPRARGRAFTRALRRRGLRAWLRGDLSPTRTRRLLRLIRRGLTLFAGSRARGPGGNRGAGLLEHLPSGFQPLPVCHQCLHALQDPKSTRQRLTGRTWPAPIQLLSRLL